MLVRLLSSLSLYSISVKILDALTASGMFLAGLIMVTRNRSLIPFHCHVPLTHTSIGSLPGHLFFSVQVPG